MRSTCDYCGIQYVILRLSRYHQFDHHFCSRMCYLRWKKEKAQKIEAICEYCGKKYKAWPSHINRAPHNFCSHSCSAKWRSENERGKNHPLWNRIEQKCTWCSKILWLSPSRIDRSTNFFCSKKCKAEWWSENMSGENHYNWKGGISFEPYPPEWNEAFRRKIRNRDNHTCAICRIFGDNVHHINYVKENTIPSNCITLCHGCHIATNYNRDYWQNELEKLMQARHNTATRWDVWGLGPEHIHVMVAKIDDRP